ncbi:hypothetical protein GNF80_03565 [Clostridium perfringens]|nr:hypothetical protein [Clostridium perfringens]
MDILTYKNKVSKMSKSIKRCVDVYNLDKLVIVSQRYHQEILDKNYHFQKSEFKLD